MQIGRLAHVAISSPDLEATTRFYREMLGVVEVARNDDTVFLSGGKKSGYDIAVGPWPTAFHHFAFQVASKADIEKASERLSGAGVAIEELDPSLDYGIAMGIRFALPSGHAMELVVQQDSLLYQATPTASSAHRSGVGPVPIEHVTLNVDDVELLSDFLTEHLAFKVTEFSHHADSPWFSAFLRCRDIHHDLGVFHQHHDEVGPGLDHFGFAVQSGSDVLDACDIARNLGLFLDCSPGRHIAGDNIFTYIKDPSGNRVEISTDLTKIDIAAPPREFTARNDSDWSGIFDAWREGVPPASRTPNPCFDARAPVAGS
jgi:catechol 2,3-dioxygenase